MTSIVVTLGDDAENTLRSATLEFMDTIRKVEHAVAASRRPDDVPEVLDISQLGVVTEEEWRAHWPTVVAEAEPEPEVDGPEAAEAEAEAEADADEAAEADEPEQADQENSVEPQ